MSTIFQIHLRTSDVDAARAFYASVLGPEVRLSVFRLHEQAVARGARPHWLGFLEVADVDSASALFTKHGATSLGPKWVNPEGIEAANMRDPGGAVIALARPPAGAQPTPAGNVEVLWHVLNAAGVERVKAAYAELCGWEFKAPTRHGELGPLFPFSWTPGGRAVGLMADIAGRPQVHPHWLFSMRVPAFEPALEAVRKGGGIVAGEYTLPSGARIAVCDDPQGAAFSIAAVAS